MPGIRYAALDAQYAKEQEAIRKKEELKDRRHQVYLCHMVSGWQRQHEERTKAAKKTKTDNGKAAIRQEDIEFVLICETPSREFRLGVSRRKEVCKTGFPILPAKGFVPGGQTEILDRKSVV